MKNVTAINCTINSKPSVKTKGEPDHAFSYLPEEKRVFALNLIKDWKAQSRFQIGLDKKTVESHYGNLERLLRTVRVAPWELTPKHVIQFFDNKVDPVTGETIGPQTYACYCSGWRSFQTFLLDLDRVNEIQRTFNVRAAPFVNDENSIAVKRAKSNKQPKGWALKPEQIDIIDKEFQRQIAVAHHSRSKALLPLQRDRVMFHICIHFALRVSELITLQMSDFHSHHDKRMAHFGDFGLLTLTGKNSVTGTVPMREPAIYQLLKWYLTSVRQKILLRRKGKGDGVCSYDEESYLVGNLLFPSEQGGVVSCNTFRKRLSGIVSQCLSTSKKVTPHTLRHTGCTLMVPLYSPEIAQKYMRHKNLYTTLGYYHPVPVDAANEANRAIILFDDDDE